MSALAAFIAKKAEIDTMLARLQELSDDHFGYTPDQISWAHVGTLEHYAELLKQITDSAFKMASMPCNLATSQEQGRMISSDAIAPDDT